VQKRLDGQRRTLNDSMPRRLLTVWSKLITYEELIRKQAGVST